MDFLEKILKLTEIRGLDQSQVESMAGLPRGRITKWKSDQGEPSAKQALRLAKALDVRLEWLVDDDENWPPTSRQQLSVDDSMISSMVEILGFAEAKRRLLLPPKGDQADVLAALGQFHKHLSYISAWVDDLRAKEEVRSQEALGRALGESVKSAQKPKDGISKANKTPPAQADLAIGEFLTLGSIMIMRIDPAIPIQSAIRGGHIAFGDDPDSMCSIHGDFHLATPTGSFASSALFHFLPEMKKQKFEMGPIIVANSNVPIAILSSNGMAIQLEGNAAYLTVYTGE